MAFVLSHASTGSAATEVREFCVARGALYAATGNWCNSGDPNGPRVIRKDGPGKPWVLEEEFPVEPYDYMACASMAALQFPGQSTILAVGFFGFPAAATKVGQNPWTIAKLGGKGAGQIRSFGQHVDSVTHQNLVFAGQNAGIVAGYFDATAATGLRWGASPELSLAGLPAMAGGHPVRVTSFANCRGKLYAAAGHQIYERQDGEAATWRKAWTNPQPGSSQTGCRGLTNIGGKLWIGVEGTKSRVAIIDPKTWADTTDLDVSGPNGYYNIVAYNDFCVAQASDGSEIILAGLDGNNAGAANYFVRHAGVWSKRRLALPKLTPQPMCSCRTVIVSPFDKARLFWGGYDCNSKPSKDTAWVLESTVDDALTAPLATDEYDDCDVAGRSLHDAAEILLFVVVFFAFVAVLRVL